MTLGGLADIRMGYSFRSRLEHDLHGDVTVIQMRDIDHGGLINAEGALRIARPVANARHLLRVGDLLFRSRGRSYGAVLVATDIGAAVVSAPMLLVRPHATEAHADRYNRFWRGVPPKSKGDYAFITHMIETALPQEGRVAVVVPHGVLFRGSAEGRIRRALIEENLLDAVIGLPGPPWSRRSSVWRPRWPTCACA